MVDKEVIVCDSLLTLFVTQFCLQILHDIFSPIVQNFNTDQ